MSVSFLWTKKFNKDYLPVIEIWIISFLTDKFLYPCVSFVYLSLLSLSVLLFKIFNFRFHVFFDWSFFHMRFHDSRYSAQCSCAIGSIVVFIYAEYFCSFLSRLFSNYDMFFSWTFICRDLQLAKDSHGGEADCKELVNP